MFFCPKCKYIFDVKKSIDEKNTDLISGSFSCNNCGYSETINKSVKLYEIDFNKKNDNSDLDLDLEDLKILSNDPTLPRTKDYTCKNINCITQHDTLNKEAIFFRDNNSYLVNYVCTVCNSKWTI